MAHPSAARMPPPVPRPPFGVGSGPGGMAPSAQPHQLKLQQASQQLASRSSVATQQQQEETRDEVSDDKVVNVEEDPEEGEIRE